MLKLLLILLSASLFANPNPDDTHCLYDDREDMAIYLAAFPFQEYKIYPTYHHRWIFLDAIDDVIKTQLRIGKAWEPHVEAMLQKYIRPNSKVVDIGAHIGLHTLSMSFYTGPRGKVVAFEPQRKLYRELYWNCQLNNANTNVELHRHAIGAKHAVIQMNPHDTGNEGSATLGHGADTAEMRTLDSYNLTNVSLIKIDVEGNEEEVLEGAKKTIKRNQPVVLISLTRNFNFETAPMWAKEKILRAKAMLKNLGYTVTTYSSSPWDYIAIPSA